MGLAVDASSFQLLLILTLALMAECTRPLQSSDTSLQVMSTIETPAKPCSHPPPLSPVQRVQFYEARQPPKAPESYLHRGYPFASPSSYKSGDKTSESTSPSEAEVQYWNFQQLHKNPAGPNPIGNDLPKGKTVVKNRSPPPMPPYGG